MREGFYGKNHHLTICARQNLEYVEEKLLETAKEEGGLKSRFDKPSVFADEEGDMEEEGNKENTRASSSDEVKNQGFKRGEGSGDVMEKEKRPSINEEMTKMTVGNSGTGKGEMKGSTSSSSSSSDAMPDI
jgi:hypothetical protein